MGVGNIKPRGKLLILLTRYFLILHFWGVYQIRIFSSYANPIRRNLLSDIDFHAPTLLCLEWFHLNESILLSYLKGSCYNHFWTKGEKINIGGECLVLSKSQRDGV